MFEAKRPRVKLLSLKIPYNELHVKNLSQSAFALHALGLNLVCTKEKVMVLEEEDATA